MSDDPSDPAPERAPTPKGVFVAGVRIMGRSIRRHPGTFAIAVTGSAVFAATTVGSTIVLGRVTDRVILPAFDEGVSAMTAVAGAAAIFAVGLVKAGGAVTRRYFAGITEARAEADLRRQLAHRYQALPLSFHRARPTGELLAHADADVLAAAQVLHPLPLSIAVLFIVVIAAVVMFLTDPILALVGMALMPALALLNKVYTSKVEEPATRAQECVGAVSAIAHESFDGALVVKTLGREDAEAARFSAAAARLRAERMLMGRVRSSFEPALAALPGVGILALLAVGTWRISAGASTAGDLVQFASLFTLLSFPMTVLGFLLAEIPRAVVGGRRIDRVLAEPVPEERRRAASLPHGPLAIEVAGLSLSYDEHQVLDEVTFAVPPSMSVALVGPTGSGKSTLVALLLGLLEPERGIVRIGGADVGRVDPGELRSSIAVAFQEAFLFATTIRDNIAVDRPLDDGEIATAAKIAQIHDFVTGLRDGYDTVVGERGLSLSGGQRQRVALARALAGRPRVLLLDDATSAVDPVVETAILHGLQRELDTTLVVVAHRVSTIRLAERVVYVDAGRVVAVGTHDELLTEQPGYAALVRAYEAEETASGEVLA